MEVKLILSLAFRIFVVLCYEYPTQCLKNPALPNLPLIYAHKKLDGHLDGVYTNCLLS